MSATNSDRNSLSNDLFSIVLAFGSLAAARMPNLLSAQPPE